MRGSGFGLRLAGGALAVASLAWGGDAAAQASMPSNLAPTREPRRLDFSVDASTTYDSNAARGNQIAADTRGVRQSDVTYSANANVDALVPFGSVTTFLAGSVGYQGYARNSDRSSERIDLRGGGKTVLGFCGTSATAGVSRGKSRLEDLTLNVPANNRQTAINLGADLSCGLPGGIGGSLSYNHSETTNTSRTGVVDSQSDGVSVALGYRNPALGALSLVGGYQETSYSQTSTLGTPPPARRLETTNVGLQYERPIGRRLVGRVGVGYVTAKTRGATTTVTSPDTEGLSADVSLSYRASPRLTTDISYRRNVTSTILAQSTYVLNEDYSFRASYRLTPRIQLSGGVTRATRTYGGDAPVPAAQRIDKDRNLTGFTSATVSIGQNSSLSLSAQYEDRKTNVTNLRYDSYRVGLTATTSF